MADSTPRSGNDDGIPTPSEPAPTPFRRRPRPGIRRRGWGSWRMTARAAPPVEGNQVEEFLDRYLDRRHAGIRGSVVEPSDGADMPEIERILDLFWLSKKRTAGGRRCHTWPNLAPEENATVAALLEEDMEPLSRLPDADAIRRTLARVSEFPAEDSLLVLRAASRHPDVDVRLETAAVLPKIGWFFDEARYSRSAADVACLHAIVVQLFRDEDEAVRAAAGAAARALPRLNAFRPRRAPIPARDRVRARVTVVVLTARDLLTDLGFWMLVGLAVAGSWAVGAADVLEVSTARWGLFYLICAITIMSPELVSLVPSYEPQPDDLSPDMEVKPELEERLHDDAVAACKVGDFETAAEIWSSLHESGNVQGSFALASLFGATNCRERHRRALEIFERLCGNDYVGIRASLASAILSLELEGSQDRCRADLAQIIESNPSWILDGGERRARDIAVVLLARDGGARTVGRFSLNGITSAWGRLIGVGDSSRTLAAAELLGLSLALDVADNSRGLRLLVPGEVGTGRRQRRWVRSGLIPAWYSGETESGAGSIYGRLVQRFVVPAARWCVNHGVRPASATMCSFLPMAASAGLIAAGALRPAAVAFAIGLVVDALDGQIAHLSGRDTRKALFFDSLADRAADLALGAGHFVFFMDREWIGLAALSLLFTAASLLVSQIRAEVSSLGLPSRIGVFERPHRMVLVFLGLVMSRPGYALFAATVFTVLTMIQRVTTAFRSAPQDPVVENRYRLSLGLVVRDDGVGGDELVVIGRTRDRRCRTA